VADNAMMLLAPDRPPGQRVSFKAGKGGDTVVAVAKRHRVTAEQVAQWNAVAADGRFRPGQTILVIKPVAAKSGKRSAVAPPERPNAGTPAAKRMATSKAAARPPAKVAATRPASKL
jgi:membrane-bound lytic murein transglycosylase D